MWEKGRAGVRGSFQQDFPMRFSDWALASFLSPPPSSLLPFLTSAASLPGLFSSPHWDFSFEISSLQKLPLILISLELNNSIVKADFLLQSCPPGSITNIKVLPNSATPQNILERLKFYVSLSAVVLGHKVCEH